MKRIDALIGGVLVVLLYTGAAFVMSWPPFHKVTPALAFCPPSGAQPSGSVNREVVIVLAPSNTFLNMQDALDSAEATIHDGLNNSGTKVTVVLADGKPKIVAKTYVDFAGDVTSTDHQTKIDDALQVVKDSYDCVISQHVVAGEMDNISSSKGQDVLHAMQLGAHSYTPEVSDKRMIVLSNGLQTSGAFKFQTGFPQGAKGAQQAITQLKRQGALGNLENATVDWVGLGQVDGTNQGALNEYSQESLQIFWSQVVTAAHGVVDSLPIGSIAESQPDENSVSSVSVRGLKDPCIQLTATEDGGFAFQSNSTAFVNSNLARSQARSFAKQIGQSGCSTAINVTGYVASNTSLRAYSQNP